MRTRRTKQHALPRGMTAIYWKYSGFLTLGGCAEEVEKGGERQRLGQAPREGEHAGLT